MQRSSVAIWGCGGSFCRGRLVLWWKEKLFRPLVTNSRPVTGRFSTLSVPETISTTTTSSTSTSTTSTSTTTAGGCFELHNGRYCSSYPRKRCHRWHTTTPSLAAVSSSSSSSSSPTRGGALGSSSWPRGQTTPPRKGFGLPPPPLREPRFRKARRKLSTTGPVSPDRLLSFSRIYETPLDSGVVEKPYTVLLLEDDVPASFFLSGGDNDTRGRNGRSDESWIDPFRSKIPRDHGMSFASMVLNLRSAPSPSSDNNNNNNDGGRLVVSISDGLQALKASRLPGISDAILVAKGPVSSLVAQYYLESFSLKGLVMIDPMLLDDNNNDDDEDDEEKTLLSLVSRLYGDDGDSIERFRSERLLVEPNAVPMMVVTTAAAVGNPAWNRSSRFVAGRHGDADGPYGRVPVLDLGGDETEEAELLDRIDDWIDEAL